MAQQPFGSFVPTTNVWDVTQIYEVDITSPEFKELLVRLYQNLNLMAIVLNNRDSGYYVQTEFLNGQLFFPNPALSPNTPTQATLRGVTRIVVNFGSLPNTGTKSVPHNATITNSTSITRIYGAASDQAGKNYIPLPYASPTAADNIELKADGTNVTVITGSDRTNFTVTYIVLEYLQQ